MKYLKQFGWILMITFIGELLNEMIPLPIPASIYGLVCMLAVLKLGWLKLEQVEQAGKWLIEIMPLMFVPAGAGLIVYWTVLREIFVPFIVIVVVSTIVVFAVTGKTAQWMLKKKAARSKKE